MELFLVIALTVILTTLFWGLVALVILAKFAEDMRPKW